MVNIWHSSRLLWAFATVVVAQFEPKISYSLQDIIAQAYAYFDDSETIVGLRNSQLEISFDAGKSWEAIKELKDHKIETFHLDPLHSERGFAFTTGDQFITNDKGKTWRKFEFEHLDKKKGPVKIDQAPTIKVNSVNNDLAIVETYECPKHSLYSLDCRKVHYVTTDGFKSPLKELVSPQAAGGFELGACTFAKAGSQFKAAETETILCSRSKMNTFGHIVESQLVRSDDYFKTEKILGHTNAKVGHVIDVRVVADFIVAVVQNDKYNADSSVSLLVSTDAIHFEVADFLVKFTYGQILFLEASTPLSIFISIRDLTSLSWLNENLYSSDSTGLKFTCLLENISRDSLHKVQTIDGVWMANVLLKEKDLIAIGTEGLKSVISFDDGKTWDSVKIDPEFCDSDKKGDCNLQFFSTVERDGVGDLVTGPTPAILLGVGSRGEEYSKFSKMEDSTWVSRNGGVTWQPAIDKPCKYVFGDLGNIITAVPLTKVSGNQIDELYYTLNQGKTWDTVKLEKPIYPMTLTDTRDGTSTKFLLTGRLSHSKHKNEAIFSLDFADAFSGKICSSSDFEEVYAREIDNKPNCLYGHKEKFMRRKQDAECFIGKLFEDVHVLDEQCECSEIDYECAPGFNNVKGECVIDEVKLEELCKGKKSITIPKYQLIRGNDCKNPKKSFEKSERISCDAQDGKTGAHNEIVCYESSFNGKMIKYTYFERTKNTPSENIILQTSNLNAYASNTGGEKFVKVPIKDEIAGYSAGYVSGHLIVFTRLNVFYVSTDGVNHFTRLEAPVSPTNGGRKLTFHKNSTDEFIWYGDHEVAYFTTDGGHTFTKINQNVNQCEYVSPFFGDKASEKNQILCEVPSRDSSLSSLIGTSDYFELTTTVFENAVGFAISGEFVICATSEDNALQAHVTVDGKIWADADFPPNMKVEPNHAYTILDSSTESIFLHVTTYNVEGKEYGTIVKSNSNGTSYAVSLDNVNRNKYGFVDFDRIDGLEGTIISNIVTNVNEVNKGAAKKTKTQISHNDGGEWLYLNPPKVDSNGKKFPCADNSLEKCSLNLHGYTERSDYRDTFSSTSATGVLIAVGNVGENLGTFADASTFISRDGGITWAEAVKGVYMWEFGDRGTILVLVDEVNPTNTFKYSIDEGITWKDYQFTDEKVKAWDIATIPSDTSLKFVIFAVNEKDSQHTKAFGIDFSNVYKRQCQLDLDNPDLDDFEYWTPKHPNLPDGCLFGHQAQYLRRTQGHECYIGAAPLKQGFKTIKNCTCTRRDYECDYNYFRDVDNTCKVVPGLNPEDRKKELCSKPNAFEWFQPTGYRKIPLSTCVDGKQFDHWYANPCPGKEKEFKQHYGKDITGSKAFTLIVVPIVLSQCFILFAVWFVYDRGIKRNGGFSRLGQIRLDLDDDDFHPIENNEVDRIVNKIVKGGIIIVAGTIATFKTIRKIDRALIDKVSSIIFRRGSRRTYVNIPNMEDEEELFNDLGDNYDNEYNEDGVHFRDETDDITNFEERDQDATEVDSELFNIEDEEDLGEN